MSLLFLLLLGCPSRSGPEGGGGPADETGGDSGSDSGADTGGDTGDDTGCPDPGTWYVDADRDGWGAGPGRVACAAEPGEVAVDGDCDDADPTAHPGAQPDCLGDGDRDCDGRLDAADEDGDGARSCRDCDDEDPARSPDLVETCHTAADDDCDGDDNDEGALGCLTWHADADGDAWGTGATRCTCAPTAGWSAGTDGDCDDADASVFPGAPEVCADAVDQDCDGSDACDVASLGQVFLGGEPGADLGTAVFAGGDLDGDGVADLVLGARLAGGTGRVAVYGGPVREGMVATVGVFGVESGAALGQELAVVDLDHDGQDDLVVAAPYADHPHRSAGAVYVLAGPIAADTTPDGARFLAYGTAGAYVGIALAAGDDWDEDGGADLLLGSYAGGYGALLGFPGAATGEGEPSTTTFAVEGDRASDLVGTSLARVGDVDGDGVDDLVFGAPFAARVGAVGMIPGPVSGAVAASDAPGWWEGTAARGGFGESVWGLVDVDGDGARDVAVASHQAVYVLTGLRDGAWTDADAALTLTDVGSYAGEGAVVAADVDGDRVPEVVVGSAYWPDAAGSTLVYGWAAGAALAPTDALATWRGAAGDRLGRTLAVAGDVDGDGREDVVLRTDADGRGGAEVGAGWLLSGALFP